MNGLEMELIGAKKIAERVEVKVESLTSNVRLGKQLGMENKAEVHPWKEMNKEWIKILKNMESIIIKEAMWSQ